VVLRDDFLPRAIRANQAREAIAQWRRDERTRNWTALHGKHTLKAPRHVSRPVKVVTSPQGISQAQFGLGGWRWRHAETLPNGSYIRVGGNPGGLDPEQETDGHRERGVIAGSVASWEITQDLPNRIGEDVRPEDLSKPVSAPTNAKLYHDANEILDAAGYTTVGKPVSSNTRGQGARAIERCQRTARKLAGDAGTTLDALQEETPNGMVHPFADAQRRIAAALSRAGFSDRDIAEAMHRTKRTVSRWTQGVKPPPKQSKPEDNWPKGRAMSGNDWPTGKEWSEIWPKMHAEIRRDVKRIERGPISTKLVGITATGPCPDFARSDKDLPIQRCSPPRDTLRSPSTPRPLAE
jgi:hypothetical protein